jgi:hypothetical protein
MSEENKVPQPVKDTVAKMLEKIRCEKPPTSIVTGLPPKPETNIVGVCSDKEPVPRPPLGVMPEKIWNERRAFDLMEALIRERDSEYGEPGHAPNKTWLIELADILPKVIGD